jgi:hypothetical protein
MPRKPSDYGAAAIPSSACLSFFPHWFGKSSHLPKAPWR